MTPCWRRARRRFQGRSCLHDSAAQGRQVPQRQGDDLRRRRRFAEAVAGHRRAARRSPRGSRVSRPKGPNAIVITLNRPYAPLLAHLALPNGFAAIWPRTRSPRRLPSSSVPARTCSGAQARSVRSIGALRRLQPAQQPANGYAGKREAWIDELRFIPCPMPTRGSRDRCRVNTSSRTPAGRIVFAGRERAQRQAGADVAVRLSLSGAPAPNEAAGELALRQAVEAALNNADMMGAGFGDPKFPRRKPVITPRTRRSTRPPGRRTTARVTPRRRPRWSRAANTTERQSRFSPASNTTSTIAWRW